MSTQESSQIKRESIPDVKNRPDSVMFVHNLVDEYGLDPYEFRIYAHAVRRTGGKPDGKYFASLSKTAEICKMSVRKAQYALKFLCEAGFLTQEKRKGRTDQYRMTHSREWAKPEDLEAIRERVTGVKRKKSKNKRQSATSQSSLTKQSHEIDVISPLNSENDVIAFNT
ncbi:MAG: helix-turn-helix domain-containing protein [Aulosira sp. ZfuVER01]|nr:helix-turn-helix domain-containing protein [Aulosira sp. ZfuVER01]MDZ8002237.1 helix-turn-helix domain-containing protein [Aulosira sp. DedVER01a]MDZ8055705.1 helix-turn-helix domain-containing protein [Aulosira sp. ZfuCHP01]